ncbi:MAG: hypothetical protein LBB94_12335 [Clostridiales bacterium]|jgi:chromosome segregation ATPase|nr:hypothetical protein [Clostridiales bacterium]
MFHKKRRSLDANRSARPYGVIFAGHLAEMDESEDLYKSVRQAVDLCDSALRNVKNRIALADRLHDCENRLGEISYIRRMSDTEISRFRNLLDRFTALSRERGNLLERLTGFDRALPLLESVRDQAGGALRGMRDAEEYHRALRHDIGCLEGEKEDLRYENDYLRAGINFISKFGAGLTALFVSAAALLGFLSATQGRDVLAYGAALIFLAVTAAVTLYLFRRRMSFELSRNGKKQRKAVHALNQKNVVYAFYCNFLNYCYNKYHVRSSQMLQTHLKEYEQYKKVAGRIDNVRDVMYETQREIEDIMREKGIDQIRSSLESFAKTINLDDQKRAYDGLISAKTEAERQLSELEQRHEDIWELLARLKQGRPAARKRVDAVIQTYLDEVGKILND